MTGQVEQHYELYVTIVSGWLLQFSSFVHAGIHVYHNAGISLYLSVESSSRWMFPYPLR